MESNNTLINRRRVLIGAIGLVLVSGRSSAQAAPAGADDYPALDGDLGYYVPRRRVCFIRNGRWVCIWR